MPASYTGKLMNKYKAIKTEVDGITFASKREARYYADLKLLERAGEITHLELQPKFPLVVNGKKVCTYIADFMFRDKDGQLKVWDVKGVITPTFQIKRKLTEALYPHITVEIVK